MVFREEIKSEKICIGLPASGEISNPVTYFDTRPSKKSSLFK